MAERNIDALIVPSNDPHQSEYVANRWKSREWITGFTGSAGLAVITKDYGGLWTDSRYFLQAEHQLDPNFFQLHKVFDRTSNNYFKWLVDNLPENARISVDGKLFSNAQIASFKKQARDKQIELVSDLDLIDEVWSDRPSRPNQEIFLFDKKYTGASRLEKLSIIHLEMEEKELDHFFLSSLDDIAWLLNIRSNDIAFNPVVLSYVLISRGQTSLFIDLEKINSETRHALEKDKINLLPYTDVFRVLAKTDSGTMGIDPSTNSYAVYESIKTKIQTIKDLTSLKKAIKNETEIAHIKTAMKKDGVALLRAYMWMEAELASGKQISEFALAEKIIACRSQQADYFGESFDAIVGYKSNGAIVHYKPEPETCSDIKNEGFLLVDCGAQYFDGTTDITRTFCFSEPTPEQKKSYTAVLRGHIGLALAKFPKGTSGIQLDVYARQALWSEGLNFMHGTGHGVGFFLNVHEKPQGISFFKSYRNEIPFQAGMITSNEPGYYETGEYGIRIENLILTKESKDEGFLENETITYFPIETKMIAFNKLNRSEVDWLNSYHQTVYEVLSPELSDEEKVWLKEKCKAI